MSKDDYLDMLHDSKKVLEAENISETDKKLIEKFAYILEILYKA